MHFTMLFQIERQLNAYMRRVEDVLGKGWETHVEGQKLKADGDSFRLKLNTQELFDDWTRKVSCPAVFEKGTCLSSLLLCTLLIPL